MAMVMYSVPLAFPCTCSGNQNLPTDVQYVPWQVVSTCLTSILQWRFMVPGTPYLDLAPSWNWIPGGPKHLPKLFEEQRDSSASSNLTPRPADPVAAPQSLITTSTSDTVDAPGFPQPRFAPMPKTMPKGTRDGTGTMPTKGSPLQKARTRARSARLAALIRSSRGGTPSQAAAPAMQKQPADRSLPDTLSSDATCFVETSPTSHAVAIWATSAKPALPPYSPGGGGRRIRLQKDRSPLLSPLPRRQPLKLCNRRDQHARRALDLGLAEVQKSFPEEVSLHKMGQVPSPPEAPPTPPPAFPSPKDIPAHNPAAGAQGDAPAPVTLQSSPLMVPASGRVEAESPSHGIQRTAQSGAMLMEPAQTPHQLPPMCSPALVGQLPKPLDGGAVQCEPTGVIPGQVDPLQRETSEPTAAVCVVSGVGRATPRAGPVASQPIAASMTPDVPRPSGERSRLRRVCLAGGRVLCVKGQNTVAVSVKWCFSLYNYYALQSWST
jgi:hypothetical protein